VGWVAMLSPPKGGDIAAEKSQKGIIKIDTHSVLSHNGFAEL
jgi:hypothetical protein